MSEVPNETEKRSLMMRFAESDDNGSSLRRVREESPKKASGDPEGEVRIALWSCWESL